MNFRAGTWGLLSVGEAVRISFRQGVWRKKNCSSEEQRFFPFDHLWSMWQHRYYNPHYVPLPVSCHRCRSARRWVRSARLRYGTKRSTRKILSSCPAPLLAALLVSPPIKPVPLLKTARHLVCHSSLIRPDISARGKLGDKCEVMYRPLNMVQLENLGAFGRWERFCGVTSFLLNTLTLD